MRLRPPRHRGRRSCVAPDGAATARVGRRSDAPGAAGVARSVQPGQCPDGGRRRRGVRRRRRAALGRHGGGSRRWPVASRCGPSATCGPDSCWPRTRPDGTSCSTWCAGSDAPLVVSINARVADGADPSWLWDVPFERLAGRSVVATGDRCRDLSVRLHYAGVAHSTDADPIQAVRRRRRADGAGGRHGAGRGGRRHRQLHRLPRSPRRRRGERGAARRRRLPRPARHLRRRRQRPDPGPAGRVARPSRSSCCRRPRTGRSRRPTSTASAGERTVRRSTPRGR